MMMKSLLTRLLVAMPIMLGAIATMASMPSPAAAQGGTLRERARQHVTNGLAAQKEGRFADAIAFYHQAYQLAPHPAILFNLGQAYRLKGDKLTALGYYRK